MKKTWMAVCLAALLVLPLAGCGGRQTGSNMTPASPSPSPTVQPTADADMMPEPEDGWEDLAGADGIVGDEDLGNVGAGNTGEENVPGQADDSPLEDLGEGVRDTLDDMGNAARNMGRDATNAIEGR